MPCLARRHSSSMKSAVYQHADQLGWAIGWIKNLAPIVSLPIAKFGKTSLRVRLCRRTLYCFNGFKSAPAKMISPLRANEETPADIANLAKLDRRCLCIAWRSVFAKRSVSPERTALGQRCREQLSVLSERPCYGARFRHGKCPCRIELIYLKAGIYL